MSNRNLLCRFDDVARKLRITQSFGGKSTTMSRWLALAATALLTLLCVSACDSSTDPPVPPVEATFVWVHHKTDSTRLKLSDITQIDVDGEAAVQLSSLIDTILVPPYRDKKGVAHEARKLYAYHIVGEDGFSASVNRGYPNNLWEHLTIGFIMTRSRNILFPKSAIDLAGAYNVKTAAHMYLKRKIDVELPDSTVFVELGTMPTVSVANPHGVPEIAVAFESIVAAVLQQPESYGFTIRALDGASPAVMTWEQFRTGYWLLQSERSMFSDPSLSTGLYKLSAVEKIIVSR